MPFTKHSSSPQGRAIIRNRYDPVNFLTWLILTIITVIGWAGLMIFIWSITIGL